ncbi:MAG: ABC transporter, partial [Gammaproteobacteria bacterium]|nr:ABC transporter [Gammaproteobacteria bacterium]
PPPGWTSHNLLRTESRSWSETGKIAGSIQFNKGSDVLGPFTLGVALTRKIPSIDIQAVSDQSSNPPIDNDTTTQRIVIIGDGDFLSNAYLGNGGNLKMGINIINWLAHDDNFIDIPVKMAIDKNLQLSPIAQGVIGFGFLFIIPLSFAGAGLFVWWSRRKS